MNTTEAIKTILIELNAGRLGASTGDSCVYEDEAGRHCAIGCLLPAPILDELREADHISGYSAYSLYEDYPELEEDIGLTQDQAACLQNWHDHWTQPCGDFRLTTEEFRAVLTGLLNGSFESIASGPFNLNHACTERVTFL